MPDHGETSLRSETSSVSCADSFPLRGEARAAYQIFPRGGRRMRCCPVFPSRAKPWQCGTLWGGTTPPSSGGRNTLDDTSPCAGEVFGLSRASRRARNARRSKLCSAPTAKTGAPALDAVPALVSQGISPLLPPTGTAAPAALGSPSGGAVMRRVTLRRLTEGGTPPRRRGGGLSPPGSSILFQIERFGEFADSTNPRTVFCISHLPHRRPRGSPLRRRRERRRLMPSLLSSRRGRPSRVARRDHRPGGSWLPLRGSCQAACHAPPLD